MEETSLKRVMTITALIVGTFTIGLPLAFFGLLLGFLTFFIWVPVLLILGSLTILLRYTHLGTIFGDGIFYILKMVQTTKYAPAFWRSIYDTISKQA